MSAPGPDGHDLTHCEFCGNRVPETLWVGLVVQRPSFDDQGRLQSRQEGLEGVFCTQEHAARWLELPLPPPTVPQSPPHPWWRPLLMPVVVLGITVIGALALVGAQSLAQWGWGR